MTPTTVSKIAILASFLAVACGPGEPEPAGTWTSATEASLSKAHADQYGRASEARDALFAGLLGELTAAMKSGGPANAIAVCRDRAPLIANEVGAELGLEIKRTSDRLRNPGNAAPDWARDVVGAEGVSADTKLFVRGSDELRALFPIRIAPACLTCHGDAASLVPAVREALAESYPDDHATGYAEGDLRGWFVVDVPSTEPR